MIAPFTPPRTATIVVTTKNRCEDLRRALRSCFRQDVPVEVLVIDDGSTDGTEAMVRGEFPGARLIRHEESAGYIVRRNEAARLAVGEVIVSLDDDAEFSAADIVRVTMAEFRTPEIAAVAIPYIDVNREQAPLQQHAPDDGAWVAGEFIGTAHALRRDLFNRMNGYREMLFHQGEESDLCIRLLEAGYQVRLGRSEPILHHESPRRNLERINRYAQRNQMLFAWHHVPGWRFPVHLAVTVAKGLWWGLKTGMLDARLEGTWAGLTAIRQEWKNRRPVRIMTYRLYRRLRKEGPQPADAVARLLAAAAVATSVPRDRVAPLASKPGSVP